MRSSPRHLQSGFTLVEILVGCAISVVGLLVIFQTIAVWNRHSQTTATGGDADVAGTLAIFNIERDLRLAGVGIATAPANLMGCTVSVTDTSSGYATTFAMAPVYIASAASAPDTIDVLYGNSAFFTSGERVISSTGTSEFLSRRNGFKQGDRVILAGTAASGVGCSLLEITDTSNPDGFTVANTSGAAYSSYYGASGAPAVIAKYNPAVAYPAVTSATLFNLGPQPRLNRWQIASAAAASNPTLQYTERIGNTGTFDVADGVINLKAQYGIDTNANHMIEAGEWTATSPLPNAWNTVLAIRVAVLVRSSQFERSPDPGASSATGPVTPAAPTWAGGTFLMTNVDGTPDNLTGIDAVPNNWRYYRYRVYEKVIPFRNMLWN